MGFEFDVSAEFTRRLATALEEAEKRIAKGPCTLAEIEDIAKTYGAPVPPLLEWLERRGYKIDYSKGVVTKR